MGGALVAALVASAEERGVEIVAGFGVDDLRRDADGWVLTGAAGRHRPRRRPRLRRVRVEPAAAGGVPAQPGDPDQRARATPATGWNSGWPRARPSTTMRAVWGVPVLQDPAHVYDGRPSGRMANVELTLPGSIW